MVSKQPSCPWSNPNLAAIDSIVAFSVARRSLAELSTFSRDCNQSAAALTVKGILAQLPPSHATQLDASAQATLGSSSTPLALPPEYRPVALRESTRSSSYFEYSLKLYLALWQWANAFRSIRYAVESGWYGFIDLGGSLTPYGSVNLTEMVLEPPFRLLTLLQTSEMLVKSFDYLLRVCEILRHCEDNAYV